MTDSKKSDHWETLASALGAEPAPEASKKVPASEPTAAASPVPPAPPAAKAPAKPPAARPRRTPADWDAVVTELGLQPQPEPSQPAASPASPIASRAAEPSPRPERSGRSDRPDSPRRPTGDVASKDSGIEETPAELIESFSRREDAKVDDSADRAPAADAVRAEREVAGETPSDASDKKPGRRRRKRRRKPRESAAKLPGDEPAAAAPEETPQAVDEEPLDVDLAKAESGSASAPPAVSEGESRPEKGRKRRRKRSPGRKKEGQAEAASEAASEKSAGRASAGHPQKPASRDERRGDRETANADRLDEESELDELDDQDDARLSKPNHRAIPTWEEAVGMIVATNLEARAKNPGGGSSRGRGRGRGSSRSS